MALVPMAYPLRSIRVRWTATLFSAFGIACTAAVLVAVLGLREGFARLFDDSKVPDDVLIYLRPGATSEGESAIRRDQAEVLKKSRKEVLKDADGSPLAAAETFLAVYVPKIDGGYTNAPIRGIEPASMKIAGSSWRLIETDVPGRTVPGPTGLFVGKGATERIANCKIGDTFKIEGQDFKVVGIFEHDGNYNTEIWGDADRLIEVLKRPFYQRVIAKIDPRVSKVKDIAKEMETDKQIPAKVQDLRSYVAGQKSALTAQLTFLGTSIGIIMGIAAILGAATTMLAGIGSRTREVGMLLAIGFGRFPIFFAFLIESAVIGMTGGIVGCAVGSIFNGAKTGTMNPQTFTETAFQLTITPSVLSSALILAVCLGLFGGVFPAMRAARMRPTQALRRH